MQLANELESIEPRVGTSPWPGHEHVRGYAVMALPFSSGHVLGLRVWPENDFAPYVSVWHRTPEGDWSMFSDGPPLEAMCQRYWGPAVREAQLARIHLPGPGLTSCASRWRARSWCGRCRWRPRPSFESRTP